MEYTVKEVSNMTGVTIKALHYYHKIGLLLPCRVTQAGYRMYGKEELERLQQILFYRELDFSLEEIKQALRSESDRIRCLKQQEDLLCARKRRIDRLLGTIRVSIDSAQKGESMSTQELFQGFDKEGWENALKPQNDYLKERYEYDMLESDEIHPEKMNEAAAEAIQFMDSMAEALRNKISSQDKKVQEQIERHLKFLNSHGTAMNETAFYNSVKFLSQDDFHRRMMEDQQTGLSYFLLSAAEHYCQKKRK